MPATQSRTNPTPPALACTYREAARLLRIDRGSTLAELIRAGRLTPVPWGRRQRIPLEQIQLLARTGFSVGGKPARAVSRRRVPTVGTGGRIRDIEVEP